MKAGLKEIADRHSTLELSAEEIQTMENLGSEADLNVIRFWEKEMK